MVEVKEYEQLSFDMGDDTEKSEESISVRNGYTSPMVNVNFCKVVEVCNMEPMQLFEGFDEFYILTYSSGMGLIRELFDKYNYTYGEIIIGSTRTVHSAQAQLEAVTEVVASQADVQNIVCSQPELQKKIEENLLEVRVMSVITDHRKTYILKNNSNGSYRIILGSANSSISAWSGNQLETYQVFDKKDDAEGIMWTECYEKNFITSREMSDPISFKAHEIKDDLTNVEDIPIIQKIVEHKEAVVIEKEYQTVEFGTNFLDIGIDPAFKKKLEESLKESEMVKKQKGKLMLIDNVRKLEAVIKERRQKEKAMHRMYSQLVLDYDNKNIIYNGKKWDLSPGEEEIASDVLKVIEYVKDYECFTGDVETIRSIFFKVLNYMFLGPFIGRMRYEAYRSAPDTFDYPLYLVMNGRPSSGKTPMILTVMKLMFDLSEQELKRNIQSETVFSPKVMEEYKTQAKGYPIFIDEISPQRWRYAKNIMKVDDAITSEGYVNLPYFLLLSNDLSAIRGDILKRCIFISVDNQIGYQYNTDDHKRMIVNLRKGMHNALYREYCRRMLEKSDELVKNIQDGKTADIFQVSSELLCEIIAQYAELPDSFRMYPKDEYIGVNSSKRRAVKWLKDMVKDNPDMYWIKRKEQRLYIDFTSDVDAKKDITMLTSELPADINYKINANILSMDLPFLEEYTGIRFKKKLFRIR